MSLQRDKLGQQPVIEWDCNPRPDYEEIEVMPGFCLYITNQSRQSEMTFDFKIQRAPFEFNCQIFGTSCYRIKQGSKLKYEGQLMPSVAGVSRLPETNGVLQTKTNQKILNICLLIDPVALDEFLDEEKILCPKSFINSLKPNTTDCYLKTYVLDSSFQLLARQIIGRQVHGPFSHIYLKAKALELLCLHLGSLKKNNMRGKSSFQLAKSDYEKIRDAHKILISDLNAPLGLPELSRLVGLNRNKLNQGFRVVYGDTVFGCLRKERLKKAKVLLLDTSLTITEVAHRLGFCSHSHFSCFFQKAFGVTPRAFRKTT